MSTFSQTQFWRENRCSLQQVDQLRGVWEPPKWGFFIWYFLYMDFFGVCTCSLHSWKLLVHTGCRWPWYVLPQSLTLQDGPEMKFIARSRGSGVRLWQWCFGKMNSGSSCWQKWKAVVEFPLKPRAISCNRSFFHLKVVYKKKKNPGKLLFNLKQEMQTQSGWL